MNRIDFYFLDFLYFLCFRYLEQDFFVNLMLLLCLSSFVLIVLEQMPLQLFLVLFLFLLLFFVLLLLFFVQQLLVYVLLLHDSLLLLHSILLIDFGFVRLLIFNLLIYFRVPLVVWRFVLVWCLILLYKPINLLLIGLIFLVLLVLRLSVLH